MRLPSLPLRAAAVALMLAVSPIGASPAAAQGRSAEDARTLNTYRLTMPVLRKVLPARYAPVAQDCDIAKNTDPNTLSIAEMIRSLERCAPVMQSLKRAGVPARDARSRSHRCFAPVSEWRCTAARPAHSLPGCCATMRCCWNRTIPSSGVYNLELSARRAAAVKDRNDTVEWRARNRRVELVRL